ncbi:hypothetical protein TNCV_3337191 [Trichonephila clavipes]|nr:hypothetical protein TNCV_3337191 [Trichonephila clavipes]
MSSDYPAENSIGGHGSRMVKVSDRGWPCHEFELGQVQAKDPPCRGAMHVKSVESSSVLPLVCCGTTCLLKMTFILKIFLLTLRTSSVIVEGVGLILQNVCDTIESTFGPDRFSATVTKNTGTQTCHQSAQIIPDLSNLKPCILISNLSSIQQVTITYGETDNSLTIPLSTKSATSVQPIGNKLDRSDTSKPPSETVNIHSDSCVAANNSNILQRNTTHEFEDSKIQTKVMGKSTTSKGRVQNIYSTTNDQMSCVKGTKHQSRSFIFRSDKVDELGEHVPLANSCSGSVDALRPNKSPSTIRHLHDKPLRELHGKTTGIKRKHLKNNGLDNSTAYPSEENETVVHHFPFNQLNLEKIVLPDSNTSSSRHLEHISSFSIDPYSIDSFIDVKSSLTCIDMLSSANLCQGFFCKDELGTLSNPNSYFEDDSTSGVDSYNVKMNQNNVDCRPTFNRQMDGRELIREWPLIPLQRDVSSSSVKEFISLAEDTQLVNKPSVERVKMHNTVHRSDSGKTEKTSVAETEGSSEENQYQMNITPNKKQNEVETKVKIIEDKNSDLEVLNSRGEGYIKPVMEIILKIAAENEHKLKNLSNDTEELHGSSGENLPTNRACNDENDTDSTEIDDSDAEIVDVITESVHFQSGSYGFLGDLVTAVVVHGKLNLRLRGQSLGEFTKDLVLSTIFVYEV